LKKTEEEKYELLTSEEKFHLVLQNIRELKMDIISLKQDSADCKNRFSILSETVRDRAGSDRNHWENIGRLRDHMYSEMDRRDRRILLVLVISLLISALIRVVLVRYF